MEVEGGLRMSTKKLLLCGVVGSPLFVFVFTVAGAVRPNYSPFRQNVSSLEVGELGWIQSANFIVTGFLFLAFSLGLRRALKPLGATWQPIIIALVALGLIGAGLFTPQSNALLHDLSSAPVFFGLPIGCVTIGHLFQRHARPGWATYSFLTGAAILVAFAFSALGFGGHPSFVRVAGLWQRISIVAGWTWILLLAVRELRSIE